jgi:hypothetical protein
MVGAAVTAAVILGLLAAVASDVPWTLELGVLAALTLVSAGATAWRIRRYRRRGAPH